MPQSRRSDRSSASIGTSIAQPIDGDRGWIVPASMGWRRRVLRLGVELHLSDLRMEAAVFNRTWNRWNGSTGVGRWLRALGVGAALAATLSGCMAHARGE